MLFLALKFRTQHSTYSCHCCRMSSAENTMLRIRTETDWLNSLIQPVVPEKLWNALPHFFQSWLRNYLSGTAVYLIVGCVWSYYIYHCFGSDLFPKGNVPKWADILEQIKVCFSSNTPLLVLLFQIP